MPSAAVDLDRVSSIAPSPRTAQTRARSADAVPFASLLEGRERPEAPRATPETMRSDAPRPSDRPERASSEARSDDAATARDSDAAAAREKSEGARSGARKTAESKDDAPSPAAGDDKAATPAEAETSDTKAAEVSAPTEEDATPLDAVAAEDSVAVLDEAAAAVPAVEIDPVAELPAPLTDEETALLIAATADSATEAAGETDKTDDAGTSDAELAALMAQTPQPEATVLPLPVTVMETGEETTEEELPLAEDGEIPLPAGDETPDGALAAPAPASMPEDAGTDTPEQPLAPLAQNRRGATPGHAVLSGETPAGEAAAARAHDALQKVGEKPGLAPAETASNADTPVGEIETPAPPRRPQLGEAGAFARVFSAETADIDTAQLMRETGESFAQRLAAQPFTPAPTTQPGAAAAGGVTGSPAVQLAAPLVAAEVVRQAQGGKTQFDIRLDPPELGRISVRLEIDPDGNTRTHLTVDRSETLDVLRQDQRALERALQQAGLKTEPGSVSLSLRDETGGFGAGRDGQAGFTGGQDGQPGGRGTGGDTRAGTDTGPEGETPPQRLSLRRLDVSI
ncbi:MAG: flagellar hook-length control protein FliK [Hyphomicrobiaceae bacterium]|nr:flagellar hook-length control protein FliK [Hyphomicrobiaceae bacterium]